MTVLDLEIKLKENNVPPIMYSLSESLPNEAYCLIYEWDEWMFYYSERGHKNIIARFLRESDACRFVLDYLIREAEKYK